MFKAVIFLAGLALGSAGTLAWLVSESDPARTAPAPVSGESLQARLENLKARFQVAWAEGQRAGEYTEEHLRRKLDAYRKGSRDSAVS